MSYFRFFFLVCLAGGIELSAQWDSLRSNNPAGIRYELKLLQPHNYRQAEIIEAELNEPRTVVTAGQQAPGEQWQAAGFLVDPPLTCGSLQNPCSTSNRTPFPQMGGIVGRGRQTATVIALNSFLPALPPGHYRIAALSRKLVLTASRPGSSTYGYPTPLQYAVSNTVEFDVLVASAVWTSQTIAASIATLKGVPLNTQDDNEKRHRAAQQLSFLNDPAAWRASLDLLPLEENELLRALMTYDASRICELMQSRITAPAQWVSSYYLSSMMQICERANLPAAPPVSGQIPKGVIGAVISATPLPPARVAPQDPKLTEYFQKQLAYRKALMNRATAMLAESLPGKQKEQKTGAFAALIQHVQQLRNNQPPEPEPAWVPILKREFIQSFSTTEIARQQYLLNMFATTFRSPEIVPLLESILDRWKAGDYYETVQSALRSLNAIDPKRAQARIIAELAKDRTWLDTPLLELLPASAAPAMDDALIASLGLAQKSGGWNPNLIMAALAKYGTPKALPRIKAIVETQQQPCQPELMAYFVRVDPAYADRVFRSTSWDMQKPPSSCTVQYFQRIPPLAMHPVFEKYLTAYLMHNDVFVKTTAARMLGRYGGATAQLPLWETFRYFHNYWKGKGTELASNGEGVMLEVEIRNAIARGRNWLATENDLHTLGSLCTSERCRADVANDLRVWQQPLRIEITDQPDGATVAQYYGLNIAALEVKLRQFPKGTGFLLNARGASASADTSRIRAFAASQGLFIAPEKQ